VKPDDFQRLKYHERTCALRANRAFCTDVPFICAENTIMDKTKTERRGHARSSITGGCAFLHPRVIDDPRGQLLVRAMSQLRDNGWGDLGRHVHV
jgi:hypothetical protein